MEGKKVIVTGASRGIGVFIARELASCGADLLLVARSEPELVRLADELRTPANTVAVAAVAVQQPHARPGNERDLRARRATTTAQTP